MCSKYAATVMAKAYQQDDFRRSSIINIASTRAFMSEPNTEGYSASKGGIVRKNHYVHLLVDLLNSFSCHVSSTVQK